MKPTRLIPTILVCLALLLTACQTAQPLPPGVPAASPVAKAVTPAAKTTGAVAVAPSPASGTASPRAATAQAPATPARPSLVTSPAATVAPPASPAATRAATTAPPTAVSPSPTPQVSPAAPGAITPATAAAPATTPTAPAPTAVPTTAVLATATPPAPTAAGPVIVFIREDTLWAASFDGSPPRQVSPDDFYIEPQGAVSTLPALVSPDGRWVIATSPKDNIGTWLLATDGSSRKQINPARLAVSWAPNSQSYAWADAEAVYIAAVNDGGARPLVRVTKPVEILPLALAWSPVGDNLAVLTRQGESKQVTLQVVPAAGGNLRPLAQAEVPSMDYGPGVVQWSANGQRLLWTWPNPPRLVGLDGQPAVTLPTGLTRWFGLAPDGRQALAVWKEGETFRLGVVDLASQARRQLAEAKGDFAFAGWSPDSRQVAYVRFPDSGPGSPRDNQLWTVNSDGTNGRRLGASTDLEPIAIEWLSPTVLLVGSGDPTEISLRRVDAGVGAVQTLVRDVAWFFAVSPRR